MEPTMTLWVFGRDERGEKFDTGGELKKARDGSIRHGDGNDSVASSDTVGQREEEGDDMAVNTMGTWLERGGRRKRQARLRA